MIKARLRQQLITRLEADLALLTEAARAAHAASTDPECQPDNKYDTTALEASYVAQGQANRAAQIRAALAAWRALKPRGFAENEMIRLGALVTLEDDAGNKLRVWLGPEAGGLKLKDEQGEIVIVTPAAPLGKALLGLEMDDMVTAGDGRELTVVSIA